MSRMRGGVRGTNRMLVLVGYASRRGGTTGLAAMLGAALETHGIDCDVRPLGAVTHLASYDAAIIAAPLYNGRWLPIARKFVRENVETLRQVPVWLVASGPLDTSAEQGLLPPVTTMARLALLVGARGTRTFGGRLEVDALGRTARLMAKTRAGDWRNSHDIAAWAKIVAADLRGSAVV